MMDLRIREFTKGLWKEIPPFRLVLGLCPALAVTKSADGGLGMGIAVTFVLLCSNVLVSLLRNVIPKKVRIASYIAIVATYVVLVEMITQAYFFPLYQKLGIFIPLIVVNCIILGRAEAFASKNPVLPSALDGLGMGIGYTLSLTVLASIREILGSGTWFGMQVMGSSYQPFSFLVEAPGAFVCLGLILGIMNSLGKR
ncbi:MAG: electron transport complex subunit RsxE [Candidatus Raymondbacteria bacterium RifOxyA12_full_50_37]|uniref:Ion-translocating oxidoreductase complex subunit E n=1 Tax=Candidatus Raymondbacteria bacterium RIFOXYD12_FULL_49_13 TaxID=1817890 RepID=A0A1F7FFS2_UNCRA|nr:MAG: electron transport complex subunit RsxE [Candidatus Raymondbacteria bacterium RifOxyA12_full_50_37]OGJ86416.1 MAG: electron transport complex subunit RsxE [Candidatus Raymondbacteria bacterium RIFOXYA2_FULL_49_16]OGJ87926.1 MAG: electron transport complex subunit RsxE [Candidatus Raymondbacteria bacterium RifOxyB12_full_50_8]OGJ95586.1 MAG: electron transport complex subunit RsxE [Candidatus Raymondbacteria bacterium RIFOXYC2_FULL_50_21]OGK05545.1 MAG: electron transport complex subunit